MCSKVSPVRKAGTLAPDRGRSQTPSPQPGLNHTTRLVKKGGRYLGPWRQCMAAQTLSDGTSAQDLPYLTALSVLRANSYWVYPAKV